VNASVLEPILCTNNNTCNSTSCTIGNMPYCPNGTAIERLCPKGSWCPDPITTKTCSIGSYCPEGSGVWKVDGLPLVCGFCRLTLHSCVACRFARRVRTAPIPRSAFSVPPATIALKVALGTAHLCEHAGLHCTFRNFCLPGSISPVKCSALSKCKCKRGCQSQDNYEPIPVLISIPVGLFLVWYCYTLVS
jgi:hypothetical protein